MTKALREGRRLRLEVDGLERPFLVDPISAHRGRYLTDLFLLGALGKLSTTQAEAIFIESLGPANYARAAGFYVDQYEDDDEDRGKYRCTWGPDGRIDDAPAQPDLLETDTEAFGLRFLAQRTLPHALVDEADTLRQEEVESLALCAFYWQTVAGFEAVEAFIAEGEGMVGSVKAMSLLQYRMAPSRSRTSPNSASASPTKQAGSSATTTPTGGERLVTLPPTRLAAPPSGEPRKKGAWYRR